MSKKIEACKENVEGKKPMAELDSETYKYWIHCNKCYYLYYKKTTAMFLLSCHHIFCEKCLVRHNSDYNNKTYKCGICSKIVHSRMISNDLPDHLKQLFHPTPWLDDLPIPRIINFQKKHREHLFQVLENYEQKCIRREEQVLKNYENMKQQVDAFRKKRAEKEKLKLHVRKILTAFKQKQRLKKAKQKLLAKNLAVTAGANSNSIPRGLTANEVGYARKRTLGLNDICNVINFSGNRAHGFFHL